MSREREPETPDGATTIVLCADDFGYRAGVDRAILDLGRRGRISATSVMTTPPGWRRSTDRLAALRPGLAVGLHLNLTDGHPLGQASRLAPGGRLLPLGRLLRQALGGGLPPAEIEAETDRQIDAFLTAFGRPPDFVDGHQHVHVVPGIRAAFLRTLARRGWSDRVWLRDPGDAPGLMLRRRAAAGKAFVVAALAAGFAAAAGRAGFATNAGFAGFSPFSPEGDVAAGFETFFTAPGARHLVMCHPGDADAESAADPIASARRRELDFLGSDGFVALLARRGLRLAPRFAGRMD